MTLEEGLRAFIERVIAVRALKGLVKTGKVKTREMKGMGKLLSRISQKKRAVGLLKYMNP